MIVSAGNVKLTLIKFHLYQFFERRKQRKGKYPENKLKSRAVNGISTVCPNNTPSLYGRDKYC